MNREYSLSDLVRIFLCLVVIICCVVMVRISKEDEHSMANASTMFVEE